MGRVVQKKFAVVIRNMKKVEYTIRNGIIHAKYFAYIMPFLINKIKKMF
jgi:hypothetical protein